MEALKRPTVVVTINRATPTPSTGSLGPAEELCLPLAGVLGGDEVSSMHSQFGRSSETEARALRRIVTAWAECGRAVHAKQESVSDP